MDRLMLSPDLVKVILRSAPTSSPPQAPSPLATEHRVTPRKDGLVHPCLLSLKWNRNCESPAPLSL